MCVYMMMHCQSRNSCECYNFMQARLLLMYGRKSGCLVHLVMMYSTNGGTDGTYKKSEQNVDC